MLSQLFWLCSLTTLSVSESVSSWFSYPIHDLNEAAVQSLISNSVQSLSKRGAFHMKNSLSPTGLSLFQRQMASIEHKRNRRQRSKNVFQDGGDLQHFDSPNHARNYETAYTIGFVGRSELSAEFVELYTYPPLLEFLKQIVINTHHANNDTLDCRSYSSLHLSAAEEGSVYAYIAEHSDRGAMHFDQHPFSCVWNILKPEQGGQLKYRFVPPVVNEDHQTYYERKLGFDWDLLHKIIVDDDEEYYERLSTNEGDVYCFKGNITVHMADQSFGEKLRAVFVTAFADYPGFKHIPEIDEVNAWGTHREDAKTDL